MPLVLMCGYPCSGKSKRAEELKSYLENSKGKTVHMAGDESIDLERNVVYAGNFNLFNYNVDKSEGHLLKKVHCDTPKETCREWNRTREKRYNDDILDALVMRFEPPESRNRWDSPLFVIQVGDNLPFDSIYDSLINRIPPPPNQATQPQPLSATNFLYELDKMTQEIVTALLNSQRTFVPGDHVTVPGTSEKVVLNRTVNMAELRRIRRQFITYTKMHPVEDTKKIANMFVQYLNSSVK
ncbi:protein KTI12 homolog [Orbicella faveolata]|uniref:protein KTI12 homolog n=2 Tax=Orbicella faveolata TaxID=48498 RepID=UPI0009E3DEE9|nr:protein KTI12 homolog [Orbicella faveolata]